MAIVRGCVEILKDPPGGPCNNIIHKDIARGVFADKFDFELSTGTSCLCTASSGTCNSHDVSRVLTGLLNEHAADHQVTSTRGSDIRDNTITVDDGNSLAGEHSNDMNNGTTTMTATKLLPPGVNEGNKSVNVRYPDEESSTVSTVNSASDNLNYFIGTLFSMWMFFLV